MSPETKDVLLIGFGAVGAIYALILQKSQKARLTVVARSNYDAINSHGMHIKSAKYGDIPGWKPDRLVKSVSDALDRPYSYVVVCTKYLPEVSATPDILRPLLSVPYTSKHPQPTYVLLQNGLNVEQDLYYAVKAAKADEEPRIISGSVWITTNLTAENIVLHGDFDRLTLGIYRPSDFIATSNTPSEQAVLDDFASIVTAGGGVAPAVPDIQGVRFQKNLWNLAFSSFATLTRHPVTALFRRQNAEKTMPAPYIADVTAELIEKYTIPTIRGVLNEALAVGRAMGYDESALPTAVVEGTIAGTKQFHMVPENNHRASMLLDIENGRPTEVEGIVGEVVRMAAHKGVDIPRIETIYALLLVVQNQILRERGA